MQVVSILSRKGRCERASIDEVYLDLTDAAESMLSENPPEILEVLDEEVLKSHILGLTEVTNYTSFFQSVYVEAVNCLLQGRGHLLSLA